MNAEYGKYYQLNNSKSYFCVQLQRMIKFEDLLVVKCGSGFFNSGHFGYLVDTSFPGGPDYDTENEIEFCDEDVISGYDKRNDRIIPHFNAPFDYNFLKESIKYTNKFKNSFYY